MPMQLWHAACAYTCHRLAEIAVNASTAAPVLYTISLSHFCCLHQTEMQVQIFKKVQH